MEKGKRKAFLLTALSLVVTVVLLSYSAYAWYTMSRTVKTTGMQMSITSPENLQISFDNGATWNTFVTLNMEELVAAMVEGYDPEQDDFFLSPASTYDATDENLFTSRTTNGYLTDMTNARLQPALPMGWNSDTATYEGGYIDIPLLFRLTSSGNGELYLTNGSAVVAVGEEAEDSGITSTVRVAFLNNEKTGNSYGGENAAVPLVFAQDPEMGARGVVTYDAATETYLPRAPRYFTYDETGAGDLPLLYLQGTTQDTEGETVYYSASLVVRIWIEGQDANCLPKIGMKSFSLILAFESSDAS